MDPDRNAFGSTYTVRKGDTMWGISKLTGVPLDELIRLNSLLLKRNPNLIHPGNQIALRPQSAASPAPSEPSDDDLVKFRVLDHPGEVQIPVEVQTSAPPQVAGAQDTNSNAPGALTTPDDAARPQSGFFENDHSRPYPPGPAQLAYGSFWGDFLRNELPQALMALPAGRGLGAALESADPALVMLRAAASRRLPQLFGSRAEPTLGGASAEADNALMGASSGARPGSAHIVGDQVRFEPGFSGREMAPAPRQPTLAGSEGGTTPAVPSIGAPGADVAPVWNPQASEGLLSQANARTGLGASLDSLHSFGPKDLRALKSSMSAGEWRAIAAHNIARLRPSDIAKMASGSKDLIFGRAGSRTRQMVEDLLSAPDIHPELLGPALAGALIHTGGDLNERASAQE